MASCRFTTEDIERIFTVFDCDFSNTITAEEFRVALAALGHRPKPSAAEAAQLLDGKPTLTKDEFVAIAQGVAETRNSVAEAKRAFTILDPTGTGKVDTEMIVKAGQLATGAAPSFELAQRIITACDQDGDNVMDEKEYIFAVTQKLKLTTSAVAEEEEAAATKAAAEASQAAAVAGAAGATGETSEKELPPGSVVKTIAGKDAVFNDKELIDLKATRDALVLLGYPTDVLSDDALSEIFNEADKDADGALTEEQYKELLTGLGELQQ